ncbi:MAG: hypothetical protein N5P05_002864 [Chroococcopsis gigantea SAG 12.99]|nr:hypothetical protein [Chroococcopsis gigantea SAG 12.99]
MPLLGEDEELFTAEMPFAENSGFFAPEITEIQNPTYVEPWEELNPFPGTVEEYSQEAAFLPETAAPALELEDNALFAPTETAQLPEIDDSFFSIIEAEENLEGFSATEELDNSALFTGETSGTIDEIGSLDELDTSFFTTPEESPELDFLESLSSEGNDNNYGLFEEMTSSSDEILDQIANQEAEEIGVSAETFSFESNTADLEFFNSLQTEETYTNASFDDLFSGPDTPTESSFSELLPTESENLAEEDSWLTGVDSPKHEDLDPFAPMDTAKIEEHNGFHQEEEDLDFLNMLEDVNYNGLEPLPSDQDIDLPFDDLFGEDAISQWDKDHPQSSSPDKLEPHQ